MPLGKVKDMQFISLGYNYRELMFDEYFIESIWRSIQFSITTLFFELSIGFLLALSLLSSFPLKSFFRSVHTLPLVIALSLIHISSPRDRTRSRMPSSA